LNSNEDSSACAVLIFSADRTFTKHYCGIFLSLGFTPVTATTTEAAIALLRLLVVTLVVVDEESGKSENGQILRRSRDMQYHAPVFVIGGTSNQDFRRQAMALGATDYLDHPASRGDIIHALLPRRSFRKDETRQHIHNR